MNDRLFLLDPEVPFGKYRGTPLSRLAADTGYLKWLLTCTGFGTAAEFARTHRAAIRAILDAETQAIMADAGPITVTEHQQEAVTKLRGQIADGADIVRLEGGAGYGKSYTVKKLLTELREEGVQSHACATSYVATQVLARDLEPYGFDVATIARTLKMTRVFDNGIESYEITADSYEAARDLLGPGKALVVDEASMVSDVIGQLLIDSVNGGTLIFVGDRYQLPPVKQETVSICCDTADPATLTKPMRYSEDSDLFRLEQLVRHQPDVFERLRYQLTEGSSEVASVPTTDALVDTYISNYKDNLDATHRLLLFRRRDVINANNEIRTKVYGVLADDVEGGERLMVLRTSDYPFVKDARLGNTVRYYSGETFVVQDCQLKVHLGIPHWEVMFQGRDKPVRVIFAVSESKMDTTSIGGKEYEAALAEAYRLGRETRNWDLYKQLQSDFVSVAYCYATSIHRAQGQTVDFAYTILGPLLAMKGLLGNALLYVALTRARKQITWLN